MKSPYLALVLLTGCLLLLQNRLMYSPDSWTLYELSRTFNSDFYAIRHVRDFAATDSHSSAFPPLWPALIFGLNSIAGLGAKAGFFLACAASLLFGILSEQAGRRLTGAKWVGLAAAAIAMAHPGFIEELLAGRTIPLQLALYAASAFLLCAPDLNGRSGALLGLVLGLAVLNRFDALPLAVALPFLALLLRASRTFLLGYAGVLAVTLSPWIAYSRQQFGSFFKSDNGGVALSSVPRHIADYLPTSPPSAFDAPAAWLAKVSANSVETVGSFLTSGGIGGPTALAVACVVLVVARRRSAEAILPEQKTALAVRRQVVVLLLMAGTLSGSILTGYGDARYFLPVFWLVSLLLLGWLAARCSAASDEKDGKKIAALLSLGVAFVFAVLLPLRTVPADPTFPLGASDRQVASCLGERAAGRVILHENASEAARLSALYGWRTVLMPLNVDALSVADIRTFLKRFGVNTLVVGEGGHPALREVVAFQPIAGCPAGWLERRPNSPDQN